MIVRAPSLGLLCLAASLGTGEPLAAADPDGLAFFEKRVRPVLVEHCYGCHSAGAEKLRGGLRLDTREGLLRGGDLGSAIVPGKPAESLLLAAVRHARDGLAMPPEGKLSERAILDLERWIAMGAPDPREAGAPPPVSDELDLEAAREFWAFRPRRDPPLPPVEDASWCETPLDRFILERLEGRGLAPAPRAELRVRYRRLSYALTGLPPDPRDLGRYLDDHRPGAWARAVDRLLASPRYGETWGRHWLDVARYADSNGLDENLAYVWAYRYRDWVIEAFDRDLPYDAFVRQQLAGDLLPVREGESERAAQARRIATGFLAVGPKMLACDDGRKMELDIIDEQVDTTTRAFLGVTLACARCHDHKFDPFRAKDYYALASIFKSTKTMENFRVVAKWYEFATPDATHRARLEAFNARSEELRLALVLQRRVAASERERAQELELAEAYLVAAEHWLGAPAERDPGFDLAALARSSAQDARVLAAWRGVFRRLGGPVKALAPHAGQASPALHETPSMLEPGRVRLIHESLTSALGNGGRQGGLRKFLDEEGLIAAIRKRAQPEADKKGEPAGDDYWLTEGTRAALAAAEKAKSEHDKKKPAPLHAMGVREGKTEDLPVHVRGNYLTLGAPARRGFPAVLATADDPAIPEGASGRLELARWIASERNPLTARVIVNRLWLWHFGEGLVRSPDNFGRLGRRPTHPELLDWLADRFVEDGWSLKKFHRRLLLSATWQQSSRFDERGQAEDPENELWWRFPRRRLRAEELRDSVLAFGGGLSLAPPGQLLPDKARAYVTGTGSKEGTYAFPVRSVYLPILRSAVYQVLQTFDFADPSVLNGQRASTTIAPQAHYFMNSREVLEATRSAAERVVRASEDSERRLRALFARAWSRAPRADELAASRAFLASYAEGLAAEGLDGAELDIRSYQGLARVLLAASEFLYLD